MSQDKLVAIEVIFRTICLVLFWSYMSAVCCNHKTTEPHFSDDSHCTAPKYSMHLFIQSIVAQTVV